MYDILFKNANIADGTGKRIYRGNVAISQDKIVSIHAEDDARAATILTLSEEEVLCPGFIDGHAHSEKYLFYDKFLKPKLLQGVTTEISGLCGLGIAPVNERYRSDLVSNSSIIGVGIDMPRSFAGMSTFSSFLDSVQANHCEINTGFYVGHGALRIAVKGYGKTGLSNTERESMRSLLREAMEAGALGMSTGLVYPPGSFATHEEIIDLCSILAEYDGIYATHMRNEGERVVESVKESIDVAERAGVRVVISHHKVTGIRNSHHLREIHDLVEKAEERGLQIYLDQYPYNTGASTLTTVIPHKYLGGGMEGLLHALHDTEQLKAIRGELLHNDGTWQNPIDSTDYEGLYIISAAETPECIGMNLLDIANLYGTDPIDAIFTLLRENQGQVVCRMVFMREDDVEIVFCHPKVMVATDSLLAAENTATHPRGYASYPKILGRFVREKNLIPLESAIKKMCSMPADLFGLKTKGTIEEGKDADIVVFNRNTILDHGDYQDPRKPNEGYCYIVVNGKIVYDRGTLIERSSGKVIRRRP